MEEEDGGGGVVGKQGVRGSGSGVAASSIGSNSLTDAVKITLGPNGRNVAMECAFSLPRVTKDSVTIAKEIELADRFENIGAQMLRKVAAKTNGVAGDSTTTSTVLAQAMISR